ncbi:MAG: MBOAT family O-acyltransferase [Candidatus Faecousia sp.]|nr:MBOAT family O-acyltransferase [Candidatus Faecousia sp.]
MAFTTQIFIFFYFPLCMILYYLSLFLQSTKNMGGVLKKLRFNDLTLIGISSVFYLWACFIDVFWFAAYIVLVYLLGNIICRLRKWKLHLIGGDTENADKQTCISLALPVFGAAVAIVVYLLIHFKLSGLPVKLWNLLSKDDLTSKSFLAPLGISFITFSAISYLADVYMGKASAGNLIDCALYLTFFPKVVSGPIVLWRDFCNQIDTRTIHLEQVSTGANRMMIGFAKKLLLADAFGVCIASATDCVDVPTAWGIALLYMLQIYYDFSGYSDIAIGLSNMLGFSFHENFNFPYLSRSISEFWRRWHISLGTWFREYIYIPLGGSRNGTGTTIRNILIVFLLTGIWHGSGWSFLLWGLINGLCNVAERLIANKRWYQKTPGILKWAATMAVTFLCWEIFRFGNLSSCISWFRLMLGQAQVSSIPYTWQYYFDKRMLFLMVSGVAGATLFGLPRVQNVLHKMIRKPLGYCVYQIIVIILFLGAILCMVNSTYSPFLYFQY